LLQFGKLQDAIYKLITLEYIYLKLDTHEKIQPVGGSPCLKLPENGKRN